MMDNSTKCTEQHQKQFENKDDEDLRLESVPEFWRMIEARRKEPTVPLEEAKKNLFADEEG